MAKRPSPAVASTNAAAAAALAGLAAATPQTQLPAALTAPAGGSGGAASGVELIALDLIDPSPLNPRKTFEPAALDELAASIAAQGLLQNLLVRPGLDGRYILICGERRWRALRLLATRGEWDPSAPKVPARVANVSEAEHRFLALTENLQRADTPPMEEADAFAELVQLGFAASAIAKQIGKSLRYVQQRLALVDRLTPEAQNAVRAGTVSFTQARALTMAPPERQRDLVKKIDRFRTADQLRDEITAGMVPTSRAIFDLATYGGKITTNDDTGARYFVDKSEFLDAQKAAATALTQALQAEWAWTRYVEGYSVPTWDYDHGPATTERGSPAMCRYEFADEDRPRAGAIVHIDPFDGRVTLHLGLLECPEPVLDPEAEAATEAAAEARRRAEANRIAAIDPFVTQIKDALRADPKGALRLLLLWPALNPHAPAPFSLLTVEGVGKNGVNGGCWRFLASHVAPADPRGIHHLKPDADLVQVWQAALKISDDDAAAALGGWVGAAVCHDIRSGVTPFMTALADHYHIEIPAPLRPDLPGREGGAP